MAGETLRELFPGKLQIYEQCGVGVLQLVRFGRCEKTRFANGAENVLTALLDRQAVLRGEADVDAILAELETSATDGARYAGAAIGSQ